MFCNKPRTLLSYLYVYSIHCVKLLSKHLEANFEHLLGMEFAADVIFLVLSSVNNDLHIYVFATGVGCEITYVGSTELNNVPYSSAKVTCTINFSDKETWMLRLIWMISVLEGSKYLKTTISLIKKRQNLKQQIIPKSILESTKICFMVFPNNMVMTSSHIVFNILLDLSDDLNYPLHAKIITFCFTIVLVIVNPIIFD